jgi:hypothetical protein
MLTIRLNDFPQPDYTITFKAEDGRQINVGRIFRANAGVPKETPWVWTIVWCNRPYPFDLPTPVVPRIAKCLLMSWSMSTWAGIEESCCNVPIGGNFVSAPP